MYDMHFKDKGHTSGVELTHGFKDQIALGTIVFIMCLEIIERVLYYVSTRPSIKPVWDHVRTNHIQLRWRGLCSCLSKALCRTHSRYRKGLSTLTLAGRRPNLLQYTFLQSSVKVPTSPEPDSPHTIIDATNLKAKTRATSALIHAPNAKYVKVKAKETKTKSKLNMESVNTYDLFKLISTLAMFTDHYGYFGLPYASWDTRSWFRIYGRFAAPGFFFLSGYASKRFRMRIWVAAIFLYFFCSLFPLNVIHTPFESILCIASINCIFRWVVPHKVLIHPLLSLVGIALGLNYKWFLGSNLGIAYGTLPFMFAIAGDLVRHKHSHRFVWIAAANALFAYSSIGVFAATDEMKHWVIGESILNSVLMACFTIVEVPVFNKLPEPLLSLIRDGIKWISRRGLIVYIGHLMLFRMIVNAAKYKHQYY